jgi:hypothetical protein
MSELDRIRFVTANYSRLQGLKIVPPGLLLFLIALWTNAEASPSRDLALPILLMVAGIIVYPLIDRYYRRNYGRVDQNRNEFWLDVLFSTIVSGLAIAAVFIDMAGKLPVSFFALLFMVSLIVDYMWMLRRSKAQSWRIFPSALAVIILIGVTSLFPLLGREAWEGLGFRSPIFIVYAVDGLLIVLYGLIGHFKLGVSLAGPKEA